MNKASINLLTAVIFGAILIAGCGSDTKPPENAYNTPPNNAPYLNANNNTNTAASPSPEPTITPTPTPTDTPAPTPAPTPENTTSTVNSEAQPSAFVLEISGNWQSSSDGSLQVGSNVTAGSSITRISNNSGDLIYIKGRRGEKVASRNCNVDDCSQGFRVAAPKPSGDSLIARGLAYVSSKFFPKPAYSVAGSRGDEDLLEAVVKIDDGKTEFMPVFKNLSAGTYVLKLTPWSDVPPAPANEKCEQTETPPPDPRIQARTGMSWNPEKDHEMLITRLGPGKYDLCLLKKSSDSDTAKIAEIVKEPSNNDPAKTAWILVVPAKDFKKASAEFSEALKLAKQWEDDGADPATKRKFLRAYLDYLAQKYSMPEKK